VLHGGRETPIRGEEWGRYGLDGREAREGDVDIVGSFGGKGSRRRRESEVAAAAVYRGPHLSVGWGTLLQRGLVLFGFGVCYGAIVQRLHDNKRISIAPVEVRGIDRASWAYLVFWGLAGVGMGSALPWVDAVWERGGREEEVDDRLDERKRGLGGVEWSDVVRGVGAFVGVAFAIVSYFSFSYFSSRRTDMRTEKVTLVIDSPTLPHSHPRKSSSLVPPRPNIHRLHTQRRHRLFRHTYPILREPFRDTRADKIFTYYKHDRIWLIRRRRKTWAYRWSSRELGNNVE